MKKVVGIRMRNAGSSRYYEKGEFPLEVGHKVIVEDENGLSLGTVSVPEIEVEDDKYSELKQITRMATKEDLSQYEQNKEDEKEAYRICQEKIKSRELPMKLIQAEYTFERNKLLFYFTADGRVDFRELVKDLAAVFRTRIELRQVGVRDETKFLGGIGICGREFCCQTFLTEFAPVSIKMAKEQKLSLNPTKISGVCGRLMCCLKNEEETYEDLNRRLPIRGELVETLEGREGIVSNVNVLKQQVSVLFEENDEKEIQTFSVEELIRKGKKPQPKQNDDVVESKEEPKEDHVKAPEQKKDQHHSHHHKRRYYDKRKEKHS